MKKITLLITILSVAFFSYGQTKSGEKVASINLGYSLTGGLINALDEADTDDISSDSFGLNGLNVNSLPAISLAFDYGIGEVFSMGIMYSIQSFSGSIDQYTWINNQGETRSESIDVGLTRNNLAILPRFHWRMQSENVDIYSGLRVGFLFWTGEVESSDPNFDDFDTFSGGRPTVGLVPIGGRFYFTDEFGANFELAIGAPYIASIGAQYRF